MHASRVIRGKIRLPEESSMRESADIGDSTLTENESAKPRDGIVVSTVLRLTTSDGERFEEVAKAMEHEAFYQILKRLVKELGWSDDEATATFALKLARNFDGLLPLLTQLQADGEALRDHLKRFRHASPE
jgi:hypothetical protein